MELFLIVTLIRILVPLLILKSPLFGILSAILVDLYDWQFLPFQTQRDYDNYQIWDKALDLYYQLIILFVVFRFKDRIAKILALFLFGYRIIGLLLASIFADRQFLFYFPNFFENFVVLYLAFLFFSKREILFSSNKNVFVVLAVVIIPKLIHEYFQHFLIKQPWEIYNIGKFLGLSGALQEYANYISWGSIFYLLPLGTVLLFLLKNKVVKNK